MSQDCRNLTTHEISISKIIKSVLYENKDNLEIINCNYPKFEYDDEREQIRLYNDSKQYYILLKIKNSINDNNNNNNNINDDNGSMMYQISSVIVQSTKNFPLLNCYCNDNNRHKYKQLSIHFSRLFFYNNHNLNGIHIKITTIIGKYVNNIKDCKLFPKKNVIKDIQTLEMAIKDNFDYNDQRIFIHNNKLLIWTIYIMCGCINKKVFTKKSKNLVSMIKRNIISPKLYYKKNRVVQKCKFGNNCRRHMEYQQCKFYHPDSKFTWCGWERENQSGKCSFVETCLYKHKNMVINDFNIFQ